MVLVQFFMAEPRLLDFCVVICRWAKMVSGVLALLAAGVRRRVDHYRFPSFVLRCSFDLALANLVYRRSMDPVKSSVSTFPCCFWDGFKDS